MQQDNKRTFPVICDLIEELAWSAYHFHEPPDGFKPNKKHTGVTKKAFKISGPRDIADAVISLIFGEEALGKRKKKRGQKGFERHDREIIKLVWKSMKKDRLKIDKALRKHAHLAKRMKGASNESVLERLRDMHQKMMREKKEAGKRKPAVGEKNKNLNMQAAHQGMLEKYPEDFSSQGESQKKLVEEELDLIRNWLIKYK